MGIATCHNLNRTTIVLRHSLHSHLRVGIERVDVHGRFLQQTCAQARLDNRQIRGEVARQCPPEKGNSNTLHTQVTDGINRDGHTLCLSVPTTQIIVVVVLLSEQERKVAVLHRIDRVVVTEGNVHNLNLVRATFPCLNHCVDVIVDTLRIDNGIVNVGSEVRDGHILLLVGLRPLVQDVNGVAVELLRAIVSPSELITGRTVCPVELEGVLVVTPHLAVRHILHRCKVNERRGSV